MVQRRDNAEVHVHGLKVRHALVTDIQAQGADGRLTGKVEGRLSFQPPCQLYTRQKTAGTGLHIPLHPGHLTGEGDTWVAFEPVVPVQQPGRIQIGVAMSVPQLLTAVAGILLAEQVKKRLRQFD